MSSKNSFFELHAMLEVFVNLAVFPVQSDVSTLDKFQELDLSMKRSREVSIEMIDFLKKRALKAPKNLLIVQYIDEVWRASVDAGVWSSTTRAECIRSLASREVSFAKRRHVTRFVPVLDKSSENLASLRSRLPVSNVEKKREMTSVVAESMPVPTKKEYTFGAFEDESDSECDLSEIPLLLPTKSIGEIPLCVQPVGRISAILRKQDDDIKRFRDHTTFYQEILPNMRREEYPVFLSDENYSTVTPQEKSLWERIASAVASKSQASMRSAIPSDKPFVNHFQRKIHYPLPSCLSHHRREKLARVVSDYYGRDAAYRAKHGLCVNSSLHLLCLYRKREIGRSLMQILVAKADIFVYVFGSGLAVPGKLSVRIPKTHTEIVVGSYVFGDPKQAAHALLPEMVNEIDQLWLLLFANIHTYSLFTPRELSIVERLLNRMASLLRTSKGRCVTDMIDDLALWKPTFSSIERLPSTSPFSSFDHLMMEKVIPLVYNSYRLQSGTEEVSVDLSRYSFQSGVEEIPASLVTPGVEIVTDGFLSATEYEHLFERLANEGGVPRSASIFGAPPNTPRQTPVLDAYVVPTASEPFTPLEPLPGVQDGSEPPRPLLSSQMKENLEIFRTLVVNLMKVPGLQGFGRVASHLMLLTTHTTWKGWLAHFNLIALDFHSCLSTEYLLEILGRFTDAFFATLAAYPPGVSVPHTQSFQAGTEGDEDAKLFTMATKVFTDTSGDFVSSSLGRALWDLLGTFSVIGCMAGSGIVGTPAKVRAYLREFSGYLRHDKYGDDALETFMTRFLRFGKVLAERVVAVVNSGDLRQLFSNELSLTEWCDTIDFIISDETGKLDVGRPAMEKLFQSYQKEGKVPRRIPKPLNIKERLELLEELVLDGSTLTARYSEDSAILGVIRAKSTAAKSEIRVLKLAGANSTYRVVPWGVYIWGAPGVGKTTVVTKIHAAVSRAQGLVGDETTMYRVDPKCNFHDTFNESQHAISMDDIDQSTAAESAAIPNHSESSNRFINVNPFSLEQADLGNKGKKFANFTTAYYTTNFQHANLRGRCEVPGQFWRRYPIKIEMRVKPEFDDGAGGIKKSAAFVNGRIMENIWLYDLSLYDPTVGGGGDKYTTEPYRKIRVFDNDADLIASLVDHFARFNAQERANFDRRAAELAQNEVCPVCFQPAGRHPDSKYCSGVAYKIQAGSETLAWFLLGVFLLRAFLHYLWDFYHSRDEHARHALWAMFMRKMLGNDQVISFVLDYSASWISSSVARTCESMAVSDLWVKMYANKEKILAACAIIITAIFALRAYFRSEPFTQQFQGDSAPNETGFPKRENQWHRLPSVLYDRPYTSKRVTTYTVGEMMTVLQQRLFVVRCPQRKSIAWGIALGNGVVIFPKHLLFDDPIGREGFINATIEVTVGNAKVLVQLDPRVSFAVERRDIVVAYVPEVPVFKEKWELLDELPTLCLATGGVRADEAWFVRKESIEKYTSRLVTQRGYLNTPERDKACWTGTLEKNTVVGDCGLPIVARFGDKFFIVGFHTAGSPGLPILAESFSRLEFDPCIAAIKLWQPNSLEVVVDPAVVEPGADSLKFQSLVEKSSVAAAIAHTPLPFVIFGTYCGSRKMGATNTSNVEATWFHARKKLPDSVIMEGYTLGDGAAIPRFGGKVVPWVLPDGSQVAGWLDPHVRSCESFRNVGGNALKWTWAENDFLSGLENLSGATGYSIPSDASVILGLVGTGSYGIDLNTSAGPPFFSKKKNCVNIDRSVDPPIVTMHPELRDGIDRILKVIDAGDVYSPTAIHALKDEVVSISKNDKCKIRVFNIMPFALNFLLKKYLSPVVDFYRLHPLFFEHAIGLNIASQHDSRTMYDFLRAHPNICASDVSDFDVSASTRELHCASRVVQRLAHHLGYTVEEKKRVWGLLMSSMHVTHVSKGDFWFTNFGLASGYWITLFLNCVRNSLQARYAYVSIGGYKVRPFRENIHQLVLGDDNISCVSANCPWFNQVSVAEALLEIGAKRTSSIKGKDLVPYEVFSEATFLKRRFVELEKGLIVCPIEKKTLCRMLTYRRKTTGISDHDHHAVILSTVLAESWMHGREYFEVMEQLARKLATEFDIAGSNFRVDAYEGYVERYKKGSLVTWNPLIDDSTEVF